MTFKICSVCWSSAWIGCVFHRVAAQRPAPRVNPSGPGTSVLLSELARVATLTPEERRRELADLEIGAASTHPGGFSWPPCWNAEDSADAFERGLKALAAM